MTLRFALWAQFLQLFATCCVLMCVLAECAQLAGGSRAVVVVLAVRVLGLLVAGRWLYRGRHLTRLSDWKDRVDLGAAVAVELGLADWHLADVVDELFALFVVVKV